MKKEKILLLPLDGSEASKAALIPAKSLSVLLNLIIHVLYISDENLTKEELIEKLKLKKEELPECCIINHRKGNPGEIILEEAAKADYIVMSTHGKTCDLSKMTGKISSSIIENSKIPVLLVRPNVNITLEDNLWKPKKILIPLNGTLGSSQALKDIHELILKTSANIHILHILSPKEKQKLELGEFTTPYYEDYPQHEWASWSKEFVKRFCSCLTEHTEVDFDFKLSQGNPGEEIISFAIQNKNDLIAVSWHGNLDKIHAQTLKKIVFEAPCPVLLTRIPD